MPKLRAPVGATSISHAGHEFLVEHGFIDIPEHLIDTAKSHGFFDPKQPTDVDGEVSLPRKLVLDILEHHGVAVAPDAPVSKLVEGLGHAITVVKDDLSELKRQDLFEIAKKAGIDLTPPNRDNDLRDKIRAARAAKQQT